MTTLLDTLVIKLAGDTADYDKALDGAQGKLDKAAKGLQSAGGTMTKAITLPLAGAAVTASKFATDFNADMANVASLGLAPERVLELKKNVQGMAISAGKDTASVASGLYDVVSAFGDSADTAMILDTNVRAAAAGLADVSDSVSLTSAVTKGYGDISAAANKKVADMAFQTVKLGQTTFPELASSMGRVVPIAASLGVKQEELFGVMATATGVTGSAAEVSTQLRGVLQSLMAPTADTAKLIEDLGYSSGEALLEQEGLQGAIGVLTKAAKDTGQPLQKYISSIEGQTLALALAGPQADVFSEKLDAMSNASGALDEAFKAQTEGINKSGFTMQQTAVKAQVLLQKLGDGLAPALSKVLDIAGPVIDRVVALADKFANADESTQTWIVTIAAVAAAVGPVLMIVGTLISTVSTVIGVIGAASGALGVLGGALAVLTGPVGLIVAAVAGLALAWQSDFLGIKTATLGAIDSIKAAWPGWIQGMQQGWQGFTQNLGQTTSTLWQNVQQGWQSGTQNLSQVASSLWQGVTQTWGQQTQAVSNLAQGHWSTLSQLWQLQTSTIQGVVRGSLQIMRGDWQGGLQTLQSTTQSVLPGIQQIFRTQIDAVRGIFNTFDWSGLGSNLARGIANGISAGVSWIRDAAKRAAKSALDAAKSLLGIRSPSKVAERELGMPTAEGFGRGFEGGMDDLSQRLGTALNGMIGDIEPMTAGAGAGPGGGITIQQTFYGPADRDTVSAASEDGVLAALRRTGQR